MVQNRIVSERKRHLKQQNDMSKLGDNLCREKYIRQQQSSEVADLLFSLISLPPPNLFMKWLLLSWVVTMSAFLALAVVLSVVRLAGMGAGRMKRTRTSDSVAGYMPPRLSKTLEKCRRSGKGMA